MFPKLFVDHIKGNGYDTPDTRNLYHPDPFAQDGENPDRTVAELTDESMAYDLQLAYNETFAKGIDPESASKMKTALQQTLNAIHFGYQSDGHLSIPMNHAESFVNAIRDALDAAKLPTPANV